MYHKQK